MIELLNGTMVWWIWIILGLVLIISEMATGTFISLGFSIAAIIVGLFILITPLEFVVQISIWIVVGTASVLVLFKWFKSKPTISSTGQSSYGFNTLGTVTQAIYPHKRGKVAFDTAVLGTREWNATSKHDLEEGKRIKIVEVNGQLIEVEPID